MTRREEIIAEAKEHEYDWGVDVDRFDVPDIFAKGAEWADKTMIDKAVKWLRENAKDYVVTCYDRGELDDEGLLYNFCKAMEE